MMKKLHRFLYRNLLAFSADTLGLGLVASQGGKRETIEVKRRRQGTSGGPQSDRRAERPQRDRQPPSGGGGGGGLPPLGGGGGGGLSGGGGGSFGRPTGGRQMPIWLVILLVIGYGIYSLLSGGLGGEDPGVSNLPEQQPVSTRAAVEPSTPLRPTATRQVARRTPAPATGDGTWTIMLYQDADDQILEQDIYLDLNEAEKIGSTDRVNIVAQVDRYRGGYQEDGNWATTRRYYVRQDNDLTRVGSDLIEDLGELNMASGDTLADFIVWAAENYPADRYALILSDHGTGWPGGWTDGDNGGSESSRIPIVARLDDNLFLMELDQTLEAARSQAGIDKFELIGMDACLMAHIEVFAALEPHAHYAVASQETEPALGWAYTGFLQELVADPNQDGAVLGSQIVETYIQEDQRIVDTQARAEFLRQGSPMGGLFRPSDVDPRQLAAQLGRNVTLTAVDLSALPALMESVNNFAVNLQDENQSVVASARTYAQSFTNIFSKNGPAPYIDLGHFAQLIAREGRSQNAGQAAQAVIDNLDQFIIAERHGSGKPGSTGVSIYFPNSTIYSSPVAGPQSYTGVADRFAQTSLWDDFLAYHYNDMPIRASEANAVMPPQGVASRAPGAGQIEVGPVELSDDVAAPGQPVRMTADITGDNIGYVYLFVGFFDQGSNSIYVADMDYLESPETRELNGVFYPVWSENDTFTIALEWEPTVFEIQAGDQLVQALFMPQSYGQSPEETIYTVEGMYHYADGENRPARLYFQNGALIQVYGFAGSEEAGAPWEITPQAGDTFTVYERWMDLDASGQVEQTVYEDGETISFGEGPIRLGEVFAAPGDYIVGFIVEDLDGNTRQSFATVTVQ